MDGRKVLKITGSVGFDPEAPVTLGAPLDFLDKSVNIKKNTLKVKATVPAGTGPGSIQVSVGDYNGWIQIE